MIERLLSKWHIRRNFRWYLKHQDRLVRRFNGKVIVIHGKQVVRCVPSEALAYSYMIRKRLLGRAIMQRVSHGDKDYTVRVGG